MTGKISFQNECDVKTLNRCENTLITNKTVKGKNNELPKLIYVNPNYGVKKHSIHVNPNMHTKTSIHINPKLNSNSKLPDNSKVETKTSIYVNPKLNTKLSIPLSSKVETKSSIYVNPKLSSKLSIPVSTKVDTKPSIYVNPKMVKDIDIMNTLQQKKISEQTRETIDNKNTEKSKSTSLQGNIQKSVHVNPKLMKTLTSSQSVKSLPVENKTVVPLNYNVYSKTNVKPESSNKSINTSFSIITRGKLIKLKRNSKSGTSIISPNKRKLVSHTLLRTTKVNESILLPSTSRPVQINSRLKFVKNKTKVSAYKLERTAVSKGKSKFTSTKVTNNFKKIVSIEGIRYNSSKNQLIRRTSTSPAKKKRIISNKVENQFFVASNGKTLRRIDATKKGHSQTTSNRISSINRSNLIRKIPANLVRQNIKSNLSFKVKQRSLQFLRNKMKKNNQPCLFFQKFGYCANQTKGTCHKVHDKKQISLCRNFLQGKCLLKDCKLSHDVGPEKMPTCKYFLEGCCSRDECPYLHVKVSEKTPICRQFLQGYCAKGNQCKERHVYACPEFEKEGTCSKGKQCPYPHKSKTQKKPGTLQINKESSTVSTASNSEDLIPCNTTESRKRYYDNLNEDLSDKRERILQKLKIMKAVQTNQTSKEIINSSDEISSRDEEASTAEYVPRKRPPVGTLPSYIPIN